MWRTRSVFISSTFLDMQEERDWLRTRVFPELEERLQARRCHLEWVDLRMGVTTAGSSAEARELQVLKVCLDEVRRCRPFLIVLLGDRYGWVPPPERIAAAANEQGLPASDVVERSVTDLEIEFGIFADPVQQTRSYFYFRDPLPYAALAPEIARLYSEALADDPDAPDRVARLASLKHRAEQVLPDRVRHYQVRWDSVRQRVAGLEAWGRMVLEDLWAELDAETSATGDDEVSWQQAERAALDDFIEDRARDFVGRQPVIAELERLALSPVDERTVRGCCVEGAAGAGKSALFGALCRRLGATDALVLAHSAGASARSASVDAMLLRWIGELAEAQGIAVPVTEATAPDAIDAAFGSLLERVAEKRRVIVMVDALDQFENTPRGRFATWLPQRWPPNARLLVTAIPGEGSKAVAERIGLGSLSLPPLDAAEALRIAQSICARYHRTLDDAVYAALIARAGADGAAWGNPLWLVLAVEELNLLDADDFARARERYEGTPAQRLNGLLIDTIAGFPADVPSLYGRMFERAEDLFGPGLVRNFLGLIAISREGWRESDFRAVLPGLSGERWDELRFASLRRLFRSQIRRRGTLKRWDASHTQMRMAIRHLLATHGIAETTLHAAVADHLLSCPPHDPLHISETMVHLLASNDSAGAAAYYVDDLSPDERDGVTAAVRDHILLSDDPQAAAEQVAELVGARNLDQDERVRAAQLHVLVLASQLESRASLAVRLSVMERAREVLADAVQEDDDADIATQLSCAIAQNTSAEILLESGRNERALRLFLESIATAERTAGDALQNRQRDFGLARSWEGVGDIHLAAGRMDEAQASFQRALAIREAMLAAAPEDAECHLAVSVALSKLGEAQLLATEAKDALATFERCLAITQRLLAADPSNVQLRSKLSNYYERIGKAHDRAGDDPEALEAFRQSYEIRAGLAAMDPDNHGWQIAVQAAAFGIGEILVRHRPVDALECYELALRLALKLLAVDHENELFMRGALVSHFGIGKCFATMDMRGEAVQAFRRCIEVAERMTRSSPDNLMWQTDLADSLYRAALCGDYPKARLTSSLAILRRLEAKGKLPGAGQALKIRVEQELERPPEN